MAGTRLDLSTLASGPVESVPGASRPSLAHLAPDLIAPTPLNPRQDFDETKLMELGESMRGGQLQPCVGVNRAAYLKIFPEHAEAVGPCRVVMAAGQRRWMAARAVGLPTVDILIRADIAGSREEFLAAVLAENMKRADFNLIEEARGLGKMLELTNGEQAAAARRLGKSKQWFNQHLGLLRLTEEMQGLVTDGTITSFRDMRRYSVLPPQDQRPAWEADQQAKRDPRPPRETAPEGAPAYTAVYPPGQGPAGGGGAAPGSAVVEPATPPPAPAAAPAPGVPGQPLAGNGGSTAGGPTAAADPDASGGGPAPAPAGPPPGTLPDTVPVPAGEQTPGAGAGIPGVGPGPRQIKMPWDDGLAVAELAIRKMDREQRRRLLARLEAEERTEADGTAAVPAAM